MSEGTKLLNIDIRPGTVSKSFYAMRGKTSVDKSNFMNLLRNVSAKAHRLPCGLWRYWLVFDCICFDAKPMNAMPFFIFLKLTIHFTKA